MCVVYQDKITKDLKTILDFFLKRIVRIFPLLWLASLLTIFISPRKFGLDVILINFTGLFGFIKPEAYIANGAWSIGNELVFYVFFPIFILSFKFLKPLFYVLIASIILALLYFAFYKLDSTQALSLQWKIYVNPFNQIHLFLGGYLIGILFKNKQINKWLCRTLLIIALSLFYFYPIDGDQINIVSGMGRLSFTIICLLITFSIYKDDYKLTGLLKKLMLYLGEASYSIYLLHQIVFSVVNGANTHYVHVNNVLTIITSVIGTFILAYFVYFYFEKPSMEKGRVQIKKLLYKN
jgi:peptidoglycan/LPS O-acetylase OafA/YrhL